MDRIKQIKKFCALLSALTLTLASVLSFSACGDKETVNPDGDETDADGEEILYSETAPEDNRDVYIIGFEDGEASEEEKQLALETIAEADPDYEILYSYVNVLDGVAVKTTEEAAETVDEMEYVNVYNSQKMKANEFEAAMFSAGEIISSYALNESGYRGEGMTIAVIDTSFDVNHELFVLSDETSAAFTREYIDSMVEKGLASTKYFVDNPDTTPYLNAKIPYAFDYYGNDTDLSDSSGHGTHVAGIIGANKLGADSSEGFDGVAPEAQLILMKVAVDNSMNIDDYALYAALDDAISLGVDAINMSFGVTAGSSESSTSSSRFYNLFNFARERGIDIFCAAGNDGALGTGSTYDTEYGISDPLAKNPDYGLLCEPASFDSAIAVASSENTFIHINRYISSSNDDVIIFSESSRSNFASELGGGRYEYVVIDGVGRSSDYSGKDVDGKLVLVMRGTIEFREKAEIAAGMGAIGLIVYNSDLNETELVNMELADAELPAAFISYEDGEKLLKCSDKTLEIVTSEVTSFASSDAQTVSAFSSVGPTPELTIKPDLIAPGGNIWSAYTDNSYQSLSGTSMATPVASGASLIIKQYLAGEESEIISDLYKKDSDFIRKLMMSSAVPMSDIDGKVEYSPRIQGAGLINISSAVNSGVIMTATDGEAAKLELGDGLTPIFSIEVKVNNITGKEQKYLLSASLISDSYKKYDGTEEYFVNGRSSAFTSAQILLDGSSMAKHDLNRYSREFDGGSEITIPADGELTLKLNINASGNMFDKYTEIFENGFYLEGYIYLEPVDSEYSAASIPFMGFCGDWDSVPIFDDIDANDAFYDYGILSYLDRDGNGLQYELGTNVFLSETEFSSDLIMISPDGDGQGEYIGLIVNPLRNVASFGIRIYDEEGEVVFNDNNMGSLTKSYYLGGGALNSAYIHYIWNGTDSENIKYILPDGKYTFELTAMTRLSNDAKQTISFDFYIDTVKPEVESVGIIEKNGRSYLEIKASDDRYLQAALVYTYADADPDSDGIDPTEEVFNSIITLAVGKQAAAKTFRFDITGNEDMEYFYLDVVDYAFNATTIKIDMSDLAE